jgi:hypothetical protein
MDEKMKKWIPVFILGGLALFGLGIYIIVNKIGMPTKELLPNEKPADFWLGLWQGAIIWLTFIASWFDSKIALYEVHNNGFWYNLAFMIGLCIAIGTGSRSTKTNDKNKKTSTKQKTTE